MTPTSIKGRISDTNTKFFFLYKKKNFQGFLDISELRNPILIIFGALESSVSRLFDVIFFEGFWWVSIVQNPRKIFQNNILYNYKSIYFSQAPIQ